MYQWGYGTWARTDLTLDELVAKRDVAALHPEFRRRLIAMIDAARAAGVTIGIGGGARSAAAQEAMFRARYTGHLTPPGIRWAGRWWRRNPGVASAAPPGSSYHEDDIAGGALAADMTGDLAWIAANGHRWRLRDFADVNNEPWHVQPVEIPTARRDYDPARHHLTPIRQDHTVLVTDDWTITHHNGTWSWDSRPGGRHLEPGRPIVLLLPGEPAIAELRVTGIAVGEGRGHIRIAPDTATLELTDAVANIDGTDRLDASTVTITTTNGAIAIAAYHTAADVKISLWTAARPRSNP